MTLKRIIARGRNLSCVNQARAPRTPVVFTLQQLNNVASQPVRQPAQRTMQPLQVMPAASRRVVKTSPPAALQRAGSFEETIKALAAQEATAVSLNEMYMFAADHSDTARTANAQFLAHELPIRMAQRVCELESLPHGLSDKKPIQQVAQLYRNYIERIIEFGDLCHDEKLFTKLLESLFLDQARIVERMAQGVIELRGEVRADPNTDWDTHMDGDVNVLLDRFFRARIGLRLLIEQHISAAHSAEGFAGVIESNCIPEEVAKGAITDARYVCQQNLGCAPEVALYASENSQSFTYVPSHMRYVLLELLKNALRATVETHRGGEGNAMPKVQVMIASGEQDVTFKIVDEGGGIKRSELKQVWTYLHSSAARPPIAEDLKKDNRHNRQSCALAGYGMGLPLSRVYAQYFGGNLVIQSMEGFGTDCYLHLCRLGGNCENLPTRVQDP